MNLYLPKKGPKFLGEIKYLPFYTHKSILNSYKNEFKKFTSIIWDLLQIRLNIDPFQNESFRLVPDSLLPKGLRPLP